MKHQLDHHCLVVLQRCENCSSKRNYPRCSPNQYQPNHCRFPRFTQGWYSDKMKCYWIRLDSTLRRLLLHNSLSTSWISIRSWVSCNPWTTSICAWRTPIQLRVLTPLKHPRHHKSVVVLLYSRNYDSNLFKRNAFTIND